MLLFSGIVCGSVFTSCQEKIEENDLIIGRWNKEEIMADPEAADCQKASYIEFADYVAEAKARTLTTFDSCTSSVTVGTYIVTGDTLIVVDEHVVTKRYIIQSIDQNKMIYKDKDNRTFTYRRIK